MSRDLLLIVAAERFLAWVVLFVISYMTYNMARRVPDHDFYIPIFGMSVESFSWGVHQFNWWVHHIAIMHGIDTHTANIYNVNLAIAGVAYIGVAVGGAMVMHPALVVRFREKWWLAATVFMLSIWAAGYAIGFMWMK